MITIELKEIERMSKKLSEIHRAALPNAVRNTLNDLAFDVKKNTLSESVIQNFKDLKSPAFFKKYSAVAKAEGWDIKKMKSTVGMRTDGGKADKTIERMHEQEVGGSLEHAYIPTDLARVGGLHKGKVLKNKWTGNITKVATVPYGNKQQLIRTVTATKIQRGGKGKGNAILYGNTLYEIKGFKRFRKKNTIELHFDRIYTYQKSRQVPVKATHFVQEAAVNTGDMMQNKFNENAQKQLAKFK